MKKKRIKKSDPKKKRMLTPEEITALDAEIERLIDRVEILMPDDNEDDINAALHELWATLDKRYAGEYKGYQGYKMKFRIVTLAMRNHIRNYNTVDLAFHTACFKEEWDVMLSDSTLTDAERMDLKYEIIKYRQMYKDYLQKEEALQEAVEAELDRMEEEGIDPDDCEPLEFPGPDPINVFPEETVCKLCGRHVADEVGSHAVPNNLIERLFSVDGKGGREKYAVERYNMARKSHQSYLGRDIYDNNQIVKLLNRNLRDDEMQEGHAHNPLTFDHIFCKDCEKRLSSIESAYSKIMRGAKSYPPALPYLFWMSVTWRMSVARLGIKLDDETEEKYRSILDNCLARKEENIVVDPDALGACSYDLFKAKDLKGELTGIFGYPIPTNTAIYIIGDTIVQFYPDKKEAEEMHKKCEPNDYVLNDGTDPEHINQVEFIQFWLVKRQILDSIDDSINPIEDKDDLELLEADAKTEQDWKDIEELEKMPPTPDVSMIYRLENAVLKHMEETGEVALFDPITEMPEAEAAEGYVVCLPNSIKRYLDYTKRHPEAKGAEVAKALGYTEEELFFMLQYFENKMEEMLADDDIQ